MKMPQALPIIGNAVITGFLGLGLGGLLPVGSAPAIGVSAMSRALASARRLDLRPDNVRPSLEDT